LRKFGAHRVRVIEVRVAPTKIFDNPFIADPLKLRLECGLNNARVELGA